MHPKHDRAAGGTLPLLSLANGICHRLVPIHARENHMAKDNPKDKRSVMVDGKPAMEYDHLRAGALDTSELAAYGMCEGGAEALRAFLAQGGAADAVRAWLVNRTGADGASAAACATALVADGYDSLDALAAGKVLACTRDLGLSARRSVEGMLAARPQIETRVSVRT